MQIHVVQPGESLWGIAQAYGVSPQELISSNQVPNPGNLVPGQTLVIPIWGRYHWVQPGESLWQIAQQYGTTVSQLLAINQIPTPAMIMPGLRLYIPQGPRPVVEANAYIEPSGDPAERDEVGDVAGDLTYVAMFDYEVNPDGTLDLIPDQAAREGARAGGAVPIMVITTIADGEFSPELGATILGSAELQDRLLDNALRIMRERGFGGLNIDFERLRPEDREAYNAFLRRAAERVRAQGYSISSALAPKISATQVGEWYEAHDYRAHGEILDFSVLMTYEWGWSGGPPMAVAPVDQVERVIQYALSEMPPQKIMMGIPLYGYDWTLPYEPGGQFARVVSPQQAIELAARYGVPIRFDETAQAPWFRYRDEQGRDHEVWFEDARSIQAKFDLVKRYGLRGVSYWRLPVSFPQNWLMLRDTFQVRKLNG